MSSTIVFVIGSLAVGGAESQLCMLAKALKARGLAVHVFALEADGPLREVLQAAAIVVHDGGYDSTASRPRKIFMLLRALGRLLSVLSAAKADVLHAYLPLTNFIGALAGRIAGVRRVITSKRALGTHQDRHPYWRNFDRLANRWSHAITINSRAVGQDAVRREGVRPSALAHIPNGIDVDRFDLPPAARGEARKNLALAEDALMLLAVGNLIEYKGHADLIRAMAVLAPTHAKVRLYIAGEDRGVGASLRRLADDLAIADRVCFLGRRLDIPELLAAADIFAMPSHEEGFSNALLEAMAAGVAAVVTDVGGNAEALMDGDLGILVPARSPAALAEGLNRLLLSDALRRGLGKAAQAHIRHTLSVEAMVEAHLRLYQNLPNKHAIPRRV